MYSTTAYQVLYLAAVLDFKILLESTRNKGGIVLYLRTDPFSKTNLSIFHHTGGDFPVSSNDGLLPAAVA